MQLVVLDGVDLVDELRCGRGGLQCRDTFARVDQRDPGAVDAGNGIGGEPGDRAQQFEQAAGAGHHLGQAAQPFAQVSFVRFPLGCGQFSRHRWFATGLGVKVTSSAVTNVR